MDEAFALAREIAKGPAAIHAVKRSMFQAFQNSYQEALKMDSDVVEAVWALQPSLRGDK